MKNKAKRIVSAVCALAMCAAMLPAAAMAEETTTSGHVSENGVTIDKTATALDENDQTNVTLSIGGTEDKEDVAVLFVLDYSTSVDVRDAAADLLGELANKDNTNVKACVINYWADAQTGTWQSVTPETNTDELLAKPENSGGTNIHAGLLAAQAALSSQEINGYETYLITISDGITYLWTDEATGDTMSVWYQNRGNGANDIQNGNSVYDMKYGEGNRIDEVQFTSLVNGDDSAKTKYEATESYFEVYGSQKPTPDETNRFISYNGTEEEYQYNKSNYLISTEIAIYKSADIYKNLISSVDHAFALKMDENHWGQYPYGEQLMDWMIGQSGSGSGMVTDDTAKTVFNGIRDQILYAIKSGTVTDVIGDHFDLTDITSFQLTVGGNSLTSTVDKEHNTVTFTDSNGGNYVVTYYPATADNSEYFTWDINAPVAKDAPLSLTYTLQLVNKETKPGTYTPPTNVSATLDYTPTVGDKGSLDFPVPHVEYTVEALKPNDPTYDELNALLDAEVQCTTTTDHATDHTDLLDGSYDVTVDATKADSQGVGATATVTVNSDRYVQHYNDNMNTGLTHTLASNTASTWTVQLVYVANETATGWTLADGQESKAVFYVSCPETTTVPSTPVPSTPTPDEHPDIAEGIANGTWGGTPTPTPTAQTTAIPQTSDDLPLGLLIIVAIAAAGAVCGLVVLRKRSKQ